MDPKRGIKDKLASIGQSVQSQQMQVLAKKYAKDPLMNDIIYMQSKDFIEGIYQINNTYEKGVELATALKLSEDQLTGYTGFVNDHLDPVAEMLKDIKCQSSSNSQSTSETSRTKECRIKNHFCIQSLSLFKIDSKIVKLCLFMTDWDRRAMELVSPQWFETLFFTKSCLPNGGTVKAENIWICLIFWTDELRTNA